MANSEIGHFAQFHCISSTHLWELSTSLSAVKGKANALHNIFSVGALILVYFSKFSQKRAGPHTGPASFSPTHRLRSDRWIQMKYLFAIVHIVPLFLEILGIDIAIVIHCELPEQLGCFALDPLPMPV